MSLPIADRIQILEPSSDVTETARYQVHALTVRVNLSVEKITLDDTYSKTPLPPYVHRPVLRLTAGSESPMRNPPPTELMYIIVRASDRAYGDHVEQIEVPPLRRGEFIGRVFATGFTTLEILDWWLARLPEQRSTPH